MLIMHAQKVYSSIQYNINILHDNFQVQTNYYLFISIYHNSIIIARLYMYHQC